MGVAGILIAGVRSRIWRCNGNAVHDGTHGGWRARQPGGTEKSKGCTGAAKPRCSPDTDRNQAIGLADVGPGIPGLDGWAGSAKFKDSSADVSFTDLVQKRPIRRTLETAYGMGEMVFLASESDTHSGLSKKHSPRRMC